MVNHVIGLLHTGSQARFGNLVTTNLIAAAQTWLNANAPGDTINILNNGHYANDDDARLLNLANDLVENTNVPVIVAAGGPQSAVAARYAATYSATRPRVNIVFTTVTDPRSLDLVQHPNRPGENLTGTIGNTSELDADRLALLHSYVSQYRPGANNVGVLINPSRPGWHKQYGPVARKARQLHLIPDPKLANQLGSIQAAFNAFRAPGYMGAVVMADSFFNSNDAAVVQAAAGVPAIYQWRNFVDRGGLMSYGPNIAVAYRTAGEFAAECALAELPKAPPQWHKAHQINFATAGPPFELVIKQSTAQALGFPLPLPAQLPNPSGPGNIQVVAIP
jgi:putative ABC transport system substrate-binding protein